MPNLNFFLIIIIIIIFSVILTLFINDYVIPTPIKTDNRYNKPILYENLGLFDLEDVFENPNAAGTDKNFIINNNNETITNLPFVYSSFLNLMPLVDSTKSFGFSISSVSRNASNFITSFTINYTQRVRPRLSFINYFLEKYNTQIYNPTYPQYRLWVKSPTANYAYIIGIFDFDFSNSNEFFINTNRVSNINVPNFTLKYDLENNIFIYKSLPDSEPPDTEILNSKEVSIIF